MKEHLKLRILLPFSITLSVILIAVFWRVTFVETERLENKALHTVEQASYLFDELVAFEAREMEVYSGLITDDMDLGENLQLTPNYLIPDLERHYNLLNSNANIHRLTVYNADCLQLVSFTPTGISKDNGLSDSSARLVDSDSVRHWLELDPDSILTIVTLTPWVSDSQTLGYLKLSQAIDTIQIYLRDVSGIESIVTTHLRSQLNDDNTDLLDTGSQVAGAQTEPVILHNTFAGLPSGLAEILGEKQKFYKPVCLEDADSNCHLHLNTRLLTDINGNPIGDLFFVFNAANSFDFASNFFTFFSSILIAIGLLLFIAFYIILGRAEKNLTRSQSQLLEESALRIREEKAHITELEQKNMTLLSTEREKQNLLDMMAQTMKHINGLYATNKVTEDIRKPKEEVINNIIKAIPDWFTHSSKCAARMIIEGKSYQDERFTESKQMIITDIKAGEFLFGSLTIGYRDESPTVSGPQFTADEKYFAEALGREFGRYLDRWIAIEEMANSERRFRSYVENASDIVYSISSEGVFYYISPNWHDKLGHTTDEVIGRPISRFIHPTDVAALEYYIKKALPSGKKTGSIEFRFKHKDNSWHWYSSSTSTVLSDDGEPLFFTGIARDITEQKIAKVQLAASEHKFRQLFEGAIDAMFIMDGERIIDCNLRASELFGYSRSEMIKLKPYEISPEKQPDGSDSRTMAIGRINEALNGQSMTFEWRHQRSNGSSFDAEISLISMIIDGRKMLQAFIRDISERKRNERTLSRLADFPKNNPNILLTVNSKAQIIYMNPATENILSLTGYSKSEIRRFLPANVESLVRKCVDEGTPVLGVEVGIDNLTWTWDFQPVKDHQIAHCYGRDITEKINREKELKKLSAAVNQSANLIYITNAEGLIEYVNPQFSRSTGFNLIEAVGRPVWSFAADINDKDAEKDAINKIAEGRTWSGHIKIRRKDGSEFWERKTITPIFDDSGEIINYLTVGEDITNEIKAQQSLAESDKLSAIGTLAAGVAHEFKNYLGGIIGNASFQLSELENEINIDTTRETFAQIIEMAERANDVAMSLLTYSKAIPEDVRYEDLSDLVSKSLSLVEKEMYNQSIEIVTYFEQLPKIRVSASKIQQLLLNLLINAEHAIKTDGVISVALIRSGDHALIKVGDTGAGIKEEHLNSIFDPFFSTKGVWGKDEIVGTGMGLAICRNIALEHNGSLTAETKVGVGTTFTLSLPIEVDKIDGAVENNETRREQNGLIFSFDKSILKDFYQEACKAGAKLLSVDNYQHIEGQISSMADFVICDSNFVGKVELYRTTAECKRYNIPYVMINCTTTEYQIAEIYDGARAIYKEIPDFSEIYLVLESYFRNKTNVPALTPS